MKHRLPLLALLLLLAAACSAPNEPTRLQGEAQGTFYTIAYCDKQHRDLRPQIDSLLHAFDLTASLWEENSLIRQANLHQPTHVNSTFCHLLNNSLQMEQYTQGAFNCKIGALVNLYGFGFENRSDITDGQVDSLLRLIHQGQCTLTLDADSLPTVILSPGVQLDFNAIAQGYSVDLLAALFDSLDVTDYLIDVGGEVRAKGSKPDGTPWTVGIERPAQNKYSAQEIETAIALTNRSVVTSGNYRKYYEQDGVRYSHTIDPATGRPVSHSLLSASVVSAEAWYADAMATAFMVMGLECSLQFIQDHPDNPDIQAAFFIYHDGSEYRTLATPAFQDIIIQ